MDIVGAYCNTPTPIDYIITKQFQLEKEEGYLAEVGTKHPLKNVLSQYKFTLRMLRPDKYRGKIRWNSIILIGGNMNISPLPKLKVSHSIISRLVIFTILASMLSSCVLMTETPTSTEEVKNELTPSKENPATQELTLVPETKAATEMPTTTLVPEPTATESSATLEGTFFFDMNGSGLRDQACFIYDAERLTDERQPLQADLLAAITAYVEDHPDIKDGDIITLEEPGLSGYTVCYKTDCILTDADGKFLIANPDTKMFYNITIADPNAGTPALEMRYINKWNKEVTVPEYTKDVDATTMGQLKAVPFCDADANALVCKLDGDTLQVRDQHLNDTEIFSFEDGISLNKDNSNEIGLMQGYITMPLTSSDFLQLDMIQGFDQDPSIKTFDYTGSTLTCSEYNICQRMDRIPGEFLNATGNDHTGIDFGYYGSPAKYNILILAGMSGYSQIRPSNGGKLKNNLDILSFIGQNFGGSSKPIMNNGHLLMYLVNDGYYLYPGQIIGIMGNTGTAIDWTHLHFEIQYGTPINNDWIGHSKDFFRQINSNLVVQNFNEQSVWTVDNLPVYVH